MATEIAQDTKVVKRPKTLSGVVVSDKMKDSAIVAVTRYTKHSKYKKYVKTMKRYAVHDPGNTVAVGDKVTIVECRPVSKTKHFRISA